MFAKRLRDLRENRNLQQKELADILNVGNSTVSMWEREERVPDSETLVKIANYFDVSVDYLLGNDQHKNSDIEEIEMLRQLLVKKGFMKNGEDLSNKELERLMTFVVNNKELFRDK